MELFDQLFFNAIVRANIANIVIQFSKTNACPEPQLAAARNSAASPEKYFLSLFINPLRKFD